MLGLDGGKWKKIYIGIDAIVGLNGDFTLPEDLKYYLEDYGISYLDYAHLWGARGFSHRYSFTTEDLDLEGTWKVLCSNYINGISHGHI